MNPGLLNTPIELMIPSGSSTRDSYGQTTTVYSGSVCFARIVRKSGGEFISNGIGSDKATYTFLIRDREDVTEKTKVKYDGREYNVTFIQEGANDMYMELSCDRMKNAS